MNARRKILAAIGAGAVVLPLTAIAQAQPRPARIGFFYFGSRQSALDTGRYATFVQSMRELGYAEGRNLVVEARYADGGAARLPALTAELVSTKPDVIVATGSAIYRALQVAAVTIPVVVTVTVDPVAAGLAASMAHPGANFTGLTDTATDLNPKLLELLMATAPQLNRVGLLLHPENYLHPDQLKKLLLVAQKLHVQIVIAEAANADTIASSLAYFARERAKAFIVLNDTFFTQQAQKIAVLAAQHKLASISANYDYSAAGGLMNYGPNLTDNFKRAAAYVDKILKGARAGDLPFEAPTRYHLVINRKTAKTLGLVIPQTLMISADKVIE